ncbi:BPSS1780 family membrane protein [Variovorax dokdonensis]|uniref:BPSS1780 family membrane protein n=1 Tax=Variovorax dokdonensis TaxID=344883 RepID=A0ABT7NC57_9BURK|nr:BPSS1780 family membrane protein [Variovorax dokdonensis]MDM0045460.1 BPSS1780 family membrane protein [Variovorax dokdonensis]
MKLQIVSARTGILWVRQGLSTFWRQPLAFISLFFFFMAIMSIASQLPFVGSAVALALLPTMTLALLAATAAAASAAPGRPPAGSVFMAALNAVRRDLKPLAVLGVIYAVGFLAVMAVSALADGGQFASIYLFGGELTQEIAQQDSFRMAVWIAMALYLPLSLAFWHAPALLHWHGVPPVKSIFFSLVACFRNFGALTVFGIVWFGVFIGAGIVISLLTGLLMAVGAMAGGATAMGSVLMIGGALVLAAMFFSSVWFTFRDSFSE